MTSFKSLLPKYGYQKEPVDFYHAVYDLFLDFNPHYDSDEQLKRHPADALTFCDQVRKSMNLPDMPDHLILGALENYRKIGKRVLATI